MLTVILITYLTISAVVLIVLIAACALAGRTQTVQVCESIDTMPSIAEVKLPHYHLRTPLSA